MFRVVDVFDVAENFVRIDRVSLFFSVVVVVVKVVRAFVFCAFAQRDGGHGCGGFDEGIGVVQLLRRRLHRVCLWNAFFPPKKLLLFIRMGKNGEIYVYLFVKRDTIRRREIRKRERTHVELVWSSVGVARHKQRAARRFEKEK